MRTASCYTNKVKIVAYAKNRKVNYQGGVAKNWEILQAALPCSPDFTVQNYVGIPIYCSQTNVCPAAIPLIEIYSGGNAQTQSPNIFSGGDVNTESVVILSGGNA
jgi:hypothetical protein